MGRNVLWNTLLTYKILEVSLCISVIEILILNESACATGLLDVSKPIPLIWELPFANWRSINFYASEQSPYLILGAMIERRTFVPSRRYLIGMGDKRRPNLFFSCCTNKNSFQDFLWRPFKTSPTFFGLIGFFERQTSICETKILTWSNLDWIYSRYFLW